MNHDNPIAIRPASVSDTEALLHIYQYYVTHTAITFEYEVPSIKEFRSRIMHTLERYPYLIAVQDGNILGYAYAGPFKTRAAYDWSAETTIYLSPDAHKRGIGRMLYQALEDSLRQMGIRNLYACIGYPQTEDEYLTRNSAQFHAHLGFSTVGTFHSCGYKFGRWYDMIWMEKLIGAHENNQPPIQPYPTISPTAVKSAGTSEVFLTSMDSLEHRNRMTPSFGIQTNT